MPRADFLVSSSSTRDARNLFGDSRTFRYASLLTQLVFVFSSAAREIYHRLVAVGVESEV